MNDETQDRFDKNLESRYLIVEYRKKIARLEKSIRQNETFIFDNCCHEWVFEYASCMNERNCYYCKHCKLYKNSYMYR
jgi:hypothetical protein